MTGNFVLRFPSLAASLFLRLRTAATPPRPSPSYRGRAAPLPLAQRRMGAMPRGAPYSAATGDHLGPGLWPSVPPPVPASLKLRALAATAAVILLLVTTRNRPRGVCHAEPGEVGVAAHEQELPPVAERGRGRR